MTFCPGIYGRAEVEYKYLYMEGQGSSGYPHTSSISLVFHTDPGFQLVKLDLSYFKLF